MRYAVRGNTFLIRVFLKSLGCTWHGYCKCWITENKNLKKSLRMLGISDKLINRIKLEKIIENPLTQISNDPY
jgi:hypothetical protein